MDIISWIIIGLIVVLLFIGIQAEGDYQKRQKRRGKPHQGKQECARRRAK